MTATRYTGTSGPTARVAGEVRHELDCGPSGELPCTVAAGYRVTTSAAATKGVAKASACAPAQIRVTNNAGGIQTFQVFDLAANPTAGAVPFDQVSVTSGGTVTLSFSVRVKLANGLAWGWSTGRDTFTEAAAGGKPCFDFYPDP